MGKIWFKMLPSVVYGRVLYIAWGERGHRGSFVLEFVATTTTYRRGILPGLNWDMSCTSRTMEGDE